MKRQFVIILKWGDISHLLADPQQYSGHYPCLSRRRPEFNSRLRRFFIFLSIIYMEKSDNHFENSSKLAAQVESHCEYLTFIRHNISQRTQVSRSSLKALETYLKDRRCKLNTQGLLQLIVELAYFLYACKTYQVAPAIVINSDVRVQ